MPRAASKLAKARHAKKLVSYADVPKVGLSGRAHNKGPSSQSGWGLTNRSQYQRRICQLELELSRMTKELEDLRRQGRILESLRLQHFELYQDCPVSHVVIDLLGRVVQYNAAFLSLIEMGPQPSKDLPFSRLLATDDKGRFLDHLVRAAKSPEPVSCDLCLLINGRQIPVHLISVARSKRRPGLRQVQTVVFDMTNQMQKQEALSKAQSDFKALVDTIQGVVWEADPTSFILAYVSPRVTELLGYRLSYWDGGLTWESHVYYEDRERVVSAMRQLAQTRKETAIEYRMLRGDGSLIWVNNRMSAARIGNRLRLFGVVIDVNDRKKAEEEVRVARDQLEERVNQRTAQLRETIADAEAFSYSLSHDLRAPLRSMQGYAQLLFNSLNQSLDATARTYFQRLINSTERMDALVRDVLKFTQVSRQPLELRPVNLEQVLADVVNSYPALLPPRLHVEVKKPLLPVRGHEALLTQCISNLLSNAAKFHRPEQGPVVRISTEALNEGKVRVWFQDNGIGIQPQDQRRIFGMFEKLHPPRQYEGTGMGLAIVAKAVQRMEGHVGVESAVNQGSKFWMELPAAG
jgi:PAS domain S-box-containing protein